MRNIALEDELSALSRHLISPLSYWRTAPAGRCSLGHAVRTRYEYTPLAS